MRTLIPINNSLKTVGNINTDAEYIKINKKNDVSLVLPLPTGAELLAPFQVTFA